MEETNPNKLARNYTLIGLFLFAAPSILLQLWTGIYQIFDTAIATNFNSTCLLYTSPSPRDVGVSRMPSSA